MTNMPRSTGCASRRQFRKKEEEEQEQERRPESRPRKALIVIRLACLPFHRSAAACWAFYANPKINTQVFLFFYLLLACTHTHKERERPQANRNKVERIKAKQTKREKPKLKPQRVDWQVGQTLELLMTGTGGGRVEWGGLGIVRDSQRVNNYNVQIV